MQVIDPSIFKAYDIRGVAGENLTADLAAQALTGSRIHGGGKRCGAGLRWTRRPAFRP